MASTSFTKRKKERQRQERGQQKAADREERKRRKAERQAATPDDVDPDIAGIIPGPQPLPEAFGDVEPDDSDDETPER